MDNRKPERILGLDLLRGIAVVLMFITHSARMRQVGSDTGTLWFFLRIEPFTLALFLYLVGFSMAVRPELPWRYLGKRALLYAALSSLFFIFQKGPQWPDALVASGSLLLIAEGVVAVGACFAARRKWAAFGALGAALLGGGAWLQAAAIYVPGLNAGNCGIAPSLVFALYGAVARSAGKAGGAVLLALGLAGFAIPGAWTYDIASTYVMYGSDPTLPGWITGVFSGRALGTYPFEYWHYTALACLRMALPLVAFGTAILWLGPRISRAPGLGALLLLGRHALAAYLFHLVVLSLVHMSGRLFPGDAVAWGFIAVLTVSAVGFVMWWERRRKGA